MRKTLVALALGLAAVSNTYAGPPEKFGTHLQGFTLTGAAVATNATGEAKVEVHDGGTALRFRVNVAGIRNLWMAHIHVAAVGSSTPVQVTDAAGPIAYWFVGGPPQQSTLSQPVNGTLAEGFIITNGDVAQWTDANDADAGTVAGLIKAMRDGRASVIVHTNDLDATTTPGVAGDSPQGELRGTLR